MIWNHAVVFNLPLPCLQVSWGSGVFLFSFLIFLSKSLFSLVTVWCKMSGFVPLLCEVPFDRLAPLWMESPFRITLFVWLRFNADSSSEMSGTTLTEAFDPPQPMIRLCWNQTTAATSVIGCWQCPIQLSRVCSDFLWPEVSNWSQGRLAVIFGLQTALLKFLHTVYSWQNNHKSETNCSRITTRTRTHSQGSKRNQPRSCWIDFTITCCIATVIIISNGIQ